MISTLRKFNIGNIDVSTRAKRGVSFEFGAGWQSSPEKRSKQAREPSYG
jgi:hypothetical protein